MSPRDIWEERQQAWSALMAIRRDIEGYPRDVVDATRIRAAHCLVTPAKFEEYVGSLEEFGLDHAPVIVKAIVGDARWLDPMIDHRARRSKDD